MCFRERPRRVLRLWRSGLVEAPVFFFSMRRRRGGMDLQERRRGGLQRGLQTHSTRAEAGGCSGAWWIEGPAQLNELKMGWVGGGGGGDSGDGGGGGGGWRRRGRVALRASEKATSMGTALTLTNPPTSVGFRHHRRTVGGILFFFASGSWKAALQLQLTPWAWGFTFL